MRSIATRAAVAVLVVSGVPGLAGASDYRLVIEGHRFQPDRLQLPAQERVQLVIENRDDTPEEFESHDLRREKIVPANAQVSLWVGPLPAGEYGFFGEFHEDTAQGKLIVVE